MGTILDITARKQAEERQQLLMAELDHRVKNVLANVSAIAHLSSLRAISVKDFVEALDGRIQAMSQAHSLLRRGNWDGADLAELVETLIRPVPHRRTEAISGSRGARGLEREGGAIACAGAPRTWRPTQ